jgi:hypothetical protein
MQLDATPFLGEMRFDALRLLALRRVGFSALERVWMTRRSLRLPRALPPAVSRYFNARRTTIGLSPQNPSAELQVLQSRPRTSPVKWQWSTHSGFIFLQIAQAPPCRATSA